MPRGSAPGERRGGRQKGVPNKATVERRLRAAHGLRAALADGIFPLDVILAQMRGQPLPDGRMPTNEQFEAAVAAAPFLHPRLATTAVVVNLTGFEADEERSKAAREKFMQALQDLAQPAPLLDGTTLTVSE